MNLPKFSIDFFDTVLSDWNYKEVYVNNVCIYSVASDVSFTISDFKKKMDHIHAQDMCVRWSSINVTPYDGNDGGVIIHFNTVVDFFS
jgi:hypothetical protein